MFASLVILALLGQQTYHLEKQCDGKKCYWVWVADPLPPPAKKVVPPPPQVIVPPVVKPLPKTAELAPEPERIFFGLINDPEPTRENIRDQDGKEYSRKQLFAVLGDGDNTLPDDAAKPHLTLVGKTPDQKKHLETLVADAAAAPLRDRYRIQVYDLSQSVDQTMLAAWHIGDDERFQHSGKVAVVQPPTTDGKSRVLGAVFDFDDAPGLAQAVAKMDPEFRLAKAADKVSAAADTWQIAAMVFIAVMICLGLIVAVAILADRGKRKER